MRSRTLAAVPFILAAIGRASAQCPTNAAGGPSLVTLTTSGNGVATDVDVGTKALTQGIPLPALSLPVCLDACDASTDADCAITSVRPDAASPGLAPPLPLLVDNVPLCVALRFPTPAPRRAAPPTPEPAR